MKVNYKSSGEACRIFQITKATLKNWKDSGHIKYKKLSPGKYLYDVDSVLSSDKENRVSVLYARVSTTKQAGDLKTQVQTIKSYMLAKGEIPAQVYEEIASGMNENRKQFNLLLEQVFQNKISKIYITYKDRLTRFGFTYFENICARFGTEIVVLNATQEEDFQQELTQDLVSIIHHFSMKLYSKRRKELKQLANSLEISEETNEFNK